MTLPRFPIRRRLFAAGAMLCMLQPALADEDRAAARVPLLPQYQQECASCHIAFPPGMLPAASWRRIMNTLPRHYGTDASLDPATVQELSAWLTAHAASGKQDARATPPEDRITRSAWFVRAHDEVPAATWKLPAVKSAANCAACHTRANEGDFNEHDIRIPR